MKISSIGERELVASMFRTGHVHGGDNDCIEIPLGKKKLLVSTDSVSYDTNIPAGASADQIGRFLAAINLSDIAAMAGNPIGMLSSFNLPGKTDSEFVLKLVESIDNELKLFDAEYLGGDTKESSVMILSGTIIGEQAERLIRRRSDIRPDQVLCVTGDLGKAAAGYTFYRLGYRKKLGIDLLMNIVPRVREAKIISENGGKFMTDLSDGIFESIYRAKRDFGIGFRLVQDEIPVNENVKKAIQLSGGTLNDMTLSFGGDYEILFTIENENYADFKSAMESEKIHVSYIGDTWKGDNIIFDGRSWSQIVGGGYQHFAPAPKIGSIS
ncbi:MAG: thiamine-monophosphate kinase [Thermoplasmataceae archaeon]